MTKPAIAILGGTGEMGLGLALRLAAAGYPVVIGSRKAERAQEAAAQVQAAVPDATVSGADNASAARDAELVLVTVPHAAQVATLTAVRDACQGKIVLDATVGLAEGDPTRPAPPEEGSMGERAQRILGDNVALVSGFHTVSGALLQDLSRSPDTDALLCGDHEDAKTQIAELAAAIGLRPVDCGPLRQARILESLTPLLIGINKRYRRRHVGIRFSGLPERLP